MENDKSIRNLKDAPDVSPQFARGKLEPRFVWLMKTDHDTDSVVQRLIEQVKKDLPYIPLEMAKEILEKQLNKTLPSHEYSAIVTAQEIASGDFVTYVGGRHYHGKEQHKSVKEAERAGRGNEMEVIGNAKINALRIARSPDWKGKRLTPFMADFSTWEEFASAMKGDTQAMFDAFFPDAVYGKIDAVTGRKDYDRAALVKKYGEEKVVELEKKAGIRHLKVKSEI